MFQFMILPVYSTLVTMKVSFLVVENLVVYFDMVHLEKAGYCSKRCLGGFSNPNCMCYNVNYSIALGNSACNLPLQLI